MKKKIALFLLALTLVTGCQPSESRVQTAIAQTQIALPTYTATFIPTLTATLTPVPTFTPSPTPDTRVISIDPKEFLLSKIDLPSDAKYYLPNSNWISPHRNIEIIQDQGAEAGEKYISETGRVDGWFAYYKRGNGRGVYPEEISDNVIMYQRASGAQLFMTKYADGLKDDGYTEIEQAPLVGDMTRVYVYKEGERVWYMLIFSYRNYVHRLQGYGLESEVNPQFMEEIAKILLGYLVEAQLSSP